MIRARQRTLTHEKIVFLFFLSVSAPLRDKIITDEK